MKHLAATVAAALALTISACSAGPGTTDEPSAGSQESILAAHDLEGLSTTEVVDRLDRLPVAERPTDLIASVRPGEVVVTDGEAEESLPVPEDRFYLSVAPYVDSTHDCFHHSLTTCRGELAGEDVAVTVVDDAGEVLVDETVTTFDNGFVGFWLPRGIEATMTVEHDGRSASTDIATGEDDPTCLTTLQLT